jgi:hypothetical protein
MRFVMELIFNAFVPKDDSDGAAAALQKAGFATHRMPIKLRHHLEHPCDDFIEVSAEGPPGPCPVGEWSNEVSDACEEFMGAIMDALGPYADHTNVVEWGPVDADYVPFSDPKWGERWTGDWEIEEARKEAEEADEIEEAQKERKEQRGNLQ